MHVDPSRGRERAHPDPPAGLLDAVGDGTNLPVGVTLADHEEIGDGGLATEVDGDHVARLPVGGGRGDQGG